MKRTRTLLLAALSLAFLAACVTVNIYFPASKVERTAETIVDDVYREGGQGAPEQEMEQEDSSALSVLLAWLGPATAHAQQATEVSNAAIRGLKQQIAQHHQQLVPYYGKGNVGIAGNGMLEVRNTDGLGVSEVAQLRRLVAADNQARSQLYQEVAKALDIDPSQVGKVQDIFAKEWRQRAQSGWWIQEDNGNWVKK
jgi:uncharacterized protein YdbL (DUF1318 family)